MILEDWTKILFCPHYNTNLNVQDPKMVLLWGGEGYHCTESSEEERTSHVKKILYFGHDLDPKL